MADQQFCLRWNNHQNTLVSVFDTLLAGGILVDCTLAAEGKFLRAHKVVLSACSPFFSDLLRQHYEQHPILIMKDVKFEQLKAMLDYMYRGEVNISQDQLGTFLKAAESLQIKGLSDSSPSNDSQLNQKIPNESRTSRLPSKPDDDNINSRLNNSSPTPRRKKRRALSGSDDKSTEEAQSDNVLESSTPPPKILSSRLSNPSSSPPATRDDCLGTSEEPLCSNTSQALPVPIAVSYDKSDPVHHQPPSLVDSVLYEPKSEYIELDDDEEDMEHEDGSEAGPSHAKNNDGFPWSMERAEDTFFSPESLGGQRGAQDTWYPSLPSHQEVAPPLYGPYSCPRCARKYAVLYTLERHLRYECGVDKQFACPVCQRRFSRRDVLRTHQKNSKHYPENEESTKTFMDMIALSSGHRKT